MGIILRFRKKNKEENSMICPCCENVFLGSFKKIVNKKEITALSVLNDVDFFYNLVDVCPHCGCSVFVEQEINSDMENCIHTNVYKNIKNNEKLHLGFKNWLLYAIMNEEGENYTLAGVSYVKVYDYMELSNVLPESDFLDHAAFCFWAKALSDNSFEDAYVAVDCKRRIRKFKEAENLLCKIKQIYEKKEYEYFLNLESNWIKDKDSSKKQLEVDLKF